MDLDTATLKEARLGPIILFYTKTKRVQPSINRQADALIQAWSRPIIKRPANFRSRYVGGEPGQKGAAGADGADAGNKGLDGGEGGTESQNTQVSGSQIKRRRFDYRKALKENEGRRQARVMVAQVSSNDFLSLVSSTSFHHDMLLLEGIASTSALWVQSDIMVQIRETRRDEPRSRTSPLPYSRQATPNLREAS